MASMFDIRHNGTDDILLWNSKIQAKSFISGKNDTNTTDSQILIKNEGSGDASVTFIVGANTQSYTMGIDNSQSDSFVIMEGTGLTGTTPDFTISRDNLINIGSSSFIPTAKLNVVSTTQGFLPPRMTGTQRDAISSPATGLVVYNTTTNKLNVYTGAGWEAVTSS